MMHCKPCEQNIFMWILCRRIGALFYYAVLSSEMPFILLRKRELVKLTKLLEACILWLIVKGLSCFFLSWLSPHPRSVWGYGREYLDKSQIPAVPMGYGAVVTIDWYITNGQMGFSSQGQIVNLLSCNQER